MTGYTKITKTEFYLTDGLSNPRNARTTRPGTGVFIYWRRDKA